MQHLGDNQLEICRAHPACGCQKASPTHACSVTGDTDKPVISRINSAARAYGSICPVVKMRPFGDSTCQQRAKGTRRAAGWLPEWDVSPAPVYSIIEWRLIPSRVRLFIDFMQASLKGYSAHDRHALV